MVSIFTLVPAERFGLVDAVVVSVIFLTHDKYPSLKVERLSWKHGFSIFGTIHMRIVCIFRRIMEFLVRHRMMRLRLTEFDSSVYISLNLNVGKLFWQVV